MELTSEGLRTYLSDNFNVPAGELTPDTPLFSSSLLDSFSMVELMSFIEESSGVRFSPSEVTLENLDSIERILSFVKTKQQS